MKARNQGALEAIGILLLFSFLCSCSSIPEINVLYSLPSGSGAFKDRRLVMVIEDERKAKDIFGEGARDDFEHFAGFFSLSVARPEESGFKVGMFQVKGMIKETLKRRLENMDLEVVPTGPPHRPRLIIALKEFFLDRKDQRWTVSIAYEARLRKDGEVLSTQNISGQAERYSLVGHKALGDALGEILTDVVNRLDLSGLFGQAHLKL